MNDLSVVLIDVTSQFILNKKAPRKGALYMKL